MKRKKNLQYGESINFATKEDLINVIGAIETMIKSITGKPMDLVHGSMVDHIKANILKDTYLNDWQKSQLEDYGWKFNESKEAISLDEESWTSDLKGTWYALFSKLRRESLKRIKDEFPNSGVNQLPK